MVPLRILPLALVLCLFFSAGQANEKIALTYASSYWPPFCHQEGGEEAKGLYLDILTEIFVKEMGLELNYQQVPWKRAQMNVQSGIADFTITVKTGERLQYTVASDDPLLRLFLNIYTYKDHPLLEEINTISSGQDIRELGIVPVTNFGNGWHEKNIDGAGVTTHYVKNEEDALRLVANKRADITIEPVHTGSYLINKFNLSDKIVPAKAHFGPLNMYLLFSRKSPHRHLVPEINRVIKRLADNGTLERISIQYSQIHPVKKKKKKYD